MKKFFAFLLACMMLMSTTAFAAYTPLAMTDVTTDLEHTLSLNATKVSGMDYEVTYNFVVSDPTVVSPEGIDAAQAFSGSPTIAPIIYGPADFKDADGNTVLSATKDIEVVWRNVTFYEPGVYSWKVTKTPTDTATDANTPFDATNAHGTFYLWVVVYNNAKGELAQEIYFKDSSELSSAKFQSVEDQFPASTVDLSIAKEVTGTQGSRDQYFKFTIELTVPSNVAQRTYQIVDTAENATTFDRLTEKTAYDSTQHTNNLAITMSGLESSSTKTLSFDMWLKHGQSFKILDLPYGIDYTITESENSGYTVSAKVDDAGDKVGFVNTTSVSSDGSMTKTTTVIYTNEKSTPVVTGIDLQTGAPIMGLMMAAAMMLMLAINKRKEAAE